MHLMKNPEITAAAKALRNHHTTANKDALIQALKDAIRKYKAHDMPAETRLNLGGTDYSAYNAGIKDLETEMAKPWYAKTWGKSKKIIKDMLETYLELFSDKGDVNIVNALLDLKKLKSHDAINALKKAIDIRRLTARGLPTLGVNSEGRQIRELPFGSTVTAARNRLDPLFVKASTDYSDYNRSIDNLEIEMAKPWYAKTWGKSAVIIKQLLEKYVELFRDKGAIDIVSALENLKKMKSQEAIESLKEAIEMRRFGARVTRKTQRKTQGDIMVQKATQQVMLPRTDPVSVRIVPKRSVTAKAPKVKQETEANVLRRIEKVALAATKNFGSVRSIKMPPKPAFTNSNSDEVASIPSLTPESDLIKPNTVSAKLPTDANTVSAKLPTDANTMSVQLPSGKVPLGQAGGQANSQAGGQANSQAGGFAPSLMSSFVANGMSLMPVASYLGYKLMKQKTGRKTRRR